MARGRKAKPRVRRSTGLNAFRAAEALVQTEIFMRASTGNGLFSFISGKGDIRMPREGYGGPLTYVNPDGKVSLSDLLQDPANSFGEMFMNLKENFIPMTIASVGVGIGFKLGKKLLKRQRAGMNYLIRESVGKGVVTV
jgi:hypothetical protein